MNAVTDDISNFRTVRQGNVLGSEPPPRPDEKPTPGNQLKRLDELERASASSGQELLKNRFLCRGGGLLLVGQTGIGKSSLSMQMMICWGLGREIFGIAPARPLKSLLIQAENDEGDLSEIRDGVFSGLNISEEDREAACSCIYTTQETTRTSDGFFQHTVEPALDEIRPDLVWIDPALAFLGGENNSQEAVGSFLRNGLAPLLKTYNCGAVVVHHTNKQSNSPDRRFQADSAYLGGGSAEWSNWSRAILTLQKTKTQDVFELRAAKRGSRLGWKEVDGTTTAYNRFIAHNKEPGTICWINAPEEVATRVAQEKSNPPDDVMKHVPFKGAISKNVVIEHCQRDGMGLNAAREEINSLVESGQLYEWRKSRKGTRPEILLARYPQPGDGNGVEIFTEIFTAETGHEHLRGHDSERSSYPHAPLGAVEIDHEDREDEDPIAPLPVDEITAYEDQSEITSAEPIPDGLSIMEASAVLDLPALPSTPFEKLLLTVGKKLVAKESPTPYMTLAEVAKACRDYNVRIPSGSPTVKDLELMCAVYFPDNREFSSDGIKVIWRTEPGERQTQTTLRFERHVASLLPIAAAHAMTQSKFRVNQPAMAN